MLLGTDFCDIEYMHMSKQIWNEVRKISKELNIVTMSVTKTGQCD